jgi:hypothetical protein
MSLKKLAKNTQKLNQQCNKDSHFSLSPPVDGRLNYAITAASAVLVKPRHHFLFQKKKNTRGTSETPHFTF